MSTCRGKGAAYSPPAPAQPPTAAPGLADAASGGLAALSLQSLGPVVGAGAGEGAHPSAPSTAHRSPGAGGAAAALSAGTVALLGCDAGGSARAALGPPASTSPGAEAAPTAVPSEHPAGGDVELSAEAAASPFSPPATERHAAFLKLVDSATKAGLQCREQRCADFSSLAAETGLPLFGNDRSGQATSLVNQSNAEVKRGVAGSAEAVGLLRRAWEVLVSLSLPLLQHRLDKGTLLPGKCRPAEEAYKVYEQQLLCRVMEQPVPSTAALKKIAACFGYSAALEAAYTALNLLPLQLGNADQRDRAQAFVLSVLGLIPHTAGLTVRILVENELVDLIDYNPARYPLGFWASLQALWRSPAVADLLRSRGALQGAIAAKAASDAEFYARQAADLEKKGLRVCGLPSCGKQETTVLQFRVCGHCQRTRYCCPEHAKQHWPAHKHEERTDG